MVDELDMSRERIWTLVWWGLMHGTRPFWKERSPCRSIGRDPHYSFGELQPTSICLTVWTGDDSYTRGSSLVPLNLPLAFWLTSFPWPLGIRTRTQNSNHLLTSNSADPRVSWPGREPRFKSYRCSLSDQEILNRGLGRPDDRHCGNS